MTQHDSGRMPAQAQQSTPEVVREEAADVGRTAAERGSDVAGTVGEQASRVASESKRQARNLMHEGKEQLSGQARQGQQRAADGLHKLADQLHQMSERSDGQGLAPEMARQAADKSHQAARWLEHREPGDLVGEVRRYARRKPGTFLLAAALAGVAVGRLTRGAVAAQHDDNGAGSSHSESGSGNGAPSAYGTYQRPAPPRSVPPPVTPATPAPYPAQQAYPPAPQPGDPALQGYPPATQPGGPEPWAPPVGDPRTGPVNR